MRKYAGASERDSIKVMLDIVNDLESGMTRQEVYDKIYTYDCEFFYFADPRSVPINDKKWSVIQLFGNEEDKKWDIKSNVVEKIHELELDI
jgi:hypothetical protein